MENKKKTNKEIRKTGERKKRGKNRIEAKEKRKEIEWKEKEEK